VNSPSNAMMFESSTSMYLPPLVPPDLRLRSLARDGFERARFQQSVVQPEPAAVEVQDFQPIAAAVEEQEQAAVERIGLELVANDATVSGKEKAGHFGAPKPAIFWTAPKT
jgi:hypothetical protein